jgi:hypothetical protein
MSGKLRGVILGLALVAARVLGTVEGFYWRRRARR